MLNILNSYEVEAIIYERQNRILKDAEVARMKRHIHALKSSKVHQGHSANIFLMNKLGTVLSHIGDHLQNQYRYKEYKHVS